MANIFIIVEYATEDESVKGIYHGFEVETAINHFEQLNEEKGDDKFVILYQIDVDEDDLEDLSEDDEYNYVADLVFADLSPYNDDFVLRRSKS